VLSKVQTEDIIEFGMIPELVGRLPVITPLEPLSVAALMQILTEPRNALVRQYQHMFRLEGATLTFTDGALRSIAEKAVKRKTGARALRAVMEELMLEMLYELPDLDNDGVEYVVDDSAVRRKPSLAELRLPRKESA